MVNVKKFHYLTSEGRSAARRRNAAWERFSAKTVTVYRSTVGRDSNLARRALALTSMSVEPAPVPTPRSVKTLKDPSNVWADVRSVRFVYSNFL